MSTERNEAPEKFLAGLIFFGIFLIVIGILNVRASNDYLFIYLGIICFLIVIAGLILLAIVRRLSIKKKRKAHMRKEILGDNFQKIFSDAIESEGKVNLKKLCEQYGVKIDELKLKIYDLIGLGNINGTIDRHYFIPDDTIKKIEISTEKDQLTVTEKKPFLPHKKITSFPPQEKKKKMSGTDFLALMASMFAIVIIMIIYWGNFPPDQYENILISLVTIAILLSFLAAIFLILPRIISRRKKRKAEIKGLVMGKNFKNIVAGMIKSKGKLSLKQLSAQLGVQVNALKLKIYGLIGTGKFTGSFEKDYFIPGENVDEFIDALLEEFEIWEEKKVGKID